MSTNAALARRFEQIARLLELLGEDKFRVNAHARAARAVEGLTRDAADLAKDRGALLAVEGIGPKAAEKIIEFVTTGKIQEHVDLLARVPPGLLDIMEIPGVGPKTAKALWDTLNVTSVADLKRVIADGSILTVPRMGAKSVEKIKGAIEIAAEGAARLPLGLAMPLAERVVARMLGVPGVTRAAFAGSLRRGRETVGDIDILVTTDNPQAAHAAFCAMAGVTQVIISGETKSSVRMRVEAEPVAQAASESPSADPAPVDPGAADSTEAGGSGVAVGRTVQVDLRVVPDESWGAALMYFTGSKEHNIRLRERSLKRGLTLNEYGLYPNDDRPEPPHKRGLTPIASRTEDGVYKALDLAFIPPEIREDRGEVGRAETNSIPRLIELGDIKAELHAHTTASDGLLSIEALAVDAQRRGFHTIAVTDHSKSAVIAGGLTPERLRAHAAEIRRTARGLEGIKLLVGSEVDILGDGSLDYADDTLDLLDVVVASPHVALSQDPAAATKRLLRAIQHPRVHILGHPTGRLIGRRAGLDPAMGELLAAAREHNVALEINAHWMRLDLRDTHVHAAVEAGCLIAIDCDVHHPDDFDNLRYGITTARRGWLTPDRCINCWPADRLHAWLRSKRA